METAAASSKVYVFTGEVALTRSRTLMNLDILSSESVAFPAKGSVAVAIRKSMPDLTGVTSSFYPSAVHAVNPLSVTGSDDNRLLVVNPAPTASGELKMPVVLFQLPLVWCLPRQSPLGLRALCIEQPTLCCGIV